MTAVVAAAADQQIIRQRMVALEKAERIRLARASEYRRLRCLEREESLRAAADLVESDPLPEYLRTAELERFVCQIRSVGRRRRAQALVHATDATGKRRLGDLSARQRAALACALRDMV